MPYTGLQCCEPRCKSLLGSHAVREGNDSGILRDIECGDSLNSRSNPRYHRCHSKEITMTQDITGLGCCEGKGCLKMAESLGSAFLCNIHHVFRMFISFSFNSFKLFQCYSALVAVVRLSFQSLSGQVGPRDDVLSWGG